MLSSSQGLFLSLRTSCVSKCRLVLAFENHSCVTMKRKSSSRGGRRDESAGGDGNDSSSSSSPSKRRSNPSTSSSSTSSSTSSSSNSAGVLPFSVMSYNCLSQTALNYHPYLYRSIPEDKLQWEFRWERLKSELTKYCADIICLQEVLNQHYDQFYYPLLSEKVQYKPWMLLLIATVT